MKNRLAITTGGALLSIALVQGCEAQVDPGYEGEPLVTLQGQVEARQSSPAEADVGVLWLTSDPEDECQGPQRSEISYSSGSVPEGFDDYECSAACGAPEDPAGPAAWVACQRACGLDAEAGSSVEYSVCGSGAIGQTTPVFGNFPAQFSLDVLHPPPARALIPSDTGERAALGYLVALSPSAQSLVISLGEGPPPWLLGGSETHVLMYAAEPIAAGSTWGVYLGGFFEPGYHLLRVQYGTRCGLPQSAPPEAGLAPAFDDQPMGDYPVPDDVGEPARADASGSSAGSAPDISSEPDYSGTANVCGNGVCEPAEDCSSCSDCTACVEGTSGISSGITNLMPGYFCLSTPSRLVAAAPGDEANIQLLIARPELIQWPDL